MSLPPLPPPCWFSLNNSEKVKAATPKFFSIELHLIIDVRAEFGIPYLPHSPDIGQNSDRGISDFQISGQFLIKRFITRKQVIKLEWILDQKLNMTWETKQRQKNLSMTSCRKIVTSLPFFPFATNLKLSGSPTPDA